MSRATPAERLIAMALSGDGMFAQARELVAVSRGAPS